MLAIQEPQTTAPAAVNVVKAAAILKRGRKLYH
jgi:hypothetical protein